MKLHPDLRTARSLLTLAGAGALVSLMLLFWPGWLNQALQTDGFAPHGACLLWESGVLSIFVGADTLIALSYFAISATLGYLVYSSRQNMPFQWVFMAFGVFIVACGTTHLMDVVTIWRPVYWLSSAVKVVTAVASVATAITLPPLVPRVLRMAAEARLSEQRRQQLEEAHRELTRLYAESQELDRLKTTFFANVSHELRTPLTLILAPARSLLDSEPPHPAREQIGLIERNATHLLALVNDLLDLARHDAGHLALRQAAGDLAALIRSVAAAFGPLLAERRLTLALDLPATLPLRMDPEKMQRVITNLFANALTWTPAEGRIACSAGADGDGALIHIDDSGPGIPAESRTRVFERFLQLADQGPRASSGTGLGLAITKELVEAHGGTISVTTAPLGGARFTIALPDSRPDTTEPLAALPDPARPNLPALPAAPEEGAPASDAAPTVLLVEDNPDLHAFLAQTLRASYRLLSARDGAEGLELALSHQPDLVITDLMMPGMSGESLIASLRQHPALAALPVLVLSAKAEEQARIELLKHGASDYLVKPFAVEELRARVANLVGLKQARDALHTRDHFLRMAAHNLRTPVTALLGYAGLLDRQIAKRCPEHAPALSRATATIQAQGQRLVRVINTLLDFLQIEQQRVTLAAEPVDLTAVMAAVGAEAQSLSQRHTIIWEADATPLMVKGDRHRLEAVIYHLLHNAIQFSPDGGTIILRAAEEAGRVRLSVTDQGIGIPAADLPYVMRPFYRASNADDVTLSGMGIGLYVAHGLAARHGGELRIERAEGGGSLASLVLTALAAAPGQA